MHNKPESSTSSGAAPVSAPEDVRLFDQSKISVSVGDEGDDNDGEAFHCDEEPHMLSPEQGYGFFPLTLGQTLRGGKLEIVRKLGWGLNSSVWLARVHEDAFPAKYVAVKVLTVNATAGVLDNRLLEPEIMGIIESRKSEHLGSKHCLHFYDAFIESSHHGPHMCIATEVLGGSLMEFRDQLQNVAVTKKVIRQTLLALGYLHSVCGVVHTDIKPDNTLVRLPNMDDVIERLLREHPSTTYEPRHEPSLSPEPIITVKSQPIMILEDEVDLNDIEIRIVDFGHAQMAGKRILSEIQPVLLRAPEVILGYPWSTPVDIWSVGCLAFEYLTGTPLFELHETNTVSLEDVHLKRMLEHLGSIPQIFLNHCERRKEYFDTSGGLLRSATLGSSTIEECLLQSHATTDSDEVSSATNFIRRCLTIDPLSRPSAKDLLSDAWLTEK